MEIFFGEDNGAGVAVRERHDLRGVNVIGDVFGPALFGKDRLAAENVPRHNGESDARRLDGEDLVDMLPCEKTAKFPRHVVEKHGVELVVEKAVHLEYTAGTDLPVGKYAPLQKLHISCPPEQKLMNRKKPVGFDRLCFG